MTRQELLALLEAQAFASMTYHRYVNEESFLFKKQIWEQTLELCRQMQAEIMSTDAVRQLWEENKL
jgi:hypothetical protein